MTTTINQKVANPNYTEQSSTFTTDITVNGLTVGKGDGNVSTNTALGVDALGSSYITSSNINNTAIGYNALNIIGAGVATFTNIIPGLYTGDDGYYQIQLEYGGIGTPVIAGGQYPNILVELYGGEVVGVNDVTNVGYGFVNNSTVMTYTGGALGTGSGFSIKASTLKSASNNVAIGYNLGTTNKTASNQILIGSNITSALDNQTIIGNAQTQKATIYGSLNAAGFDSEPTNIATANFVGDITIGSLQPSGSGIITIGRSTLGETVNIGVGAISNNSKTVNIGTGATDGGTEINIGTYEAGNVIRIGGGTAPETLDILNSSSSKIINIAATTIAGALDTSVITIGEGDKTSIALNGTLTATGTLQLTGRATDNQKIATAQTSGSLTIGGTSATGSITLGQSSSAQTVQIGGSGTSAVTVGGATGTGVLTFGIGNGAQTVNIATGVNNISAKTLNLGTGSQNGATTITIGPTGVNSGSTTIDIGTQARTRNATTVNIGTNATGGNSYVNLGSAIGGSITTISSVTTSSNSLLTTFNGTVTTNGVTIQQTKTVGTLPSYSLVAGMRFFVTDCTALTALFGMQPVGGGAVGVPVYYDGTSWKVG
jgi:hypothetical protein